MRARIEASSDCIGVLGKFSDFEETYAGPIGDGVITGVEFIGIRKRLPGLLKTAEDKGFNTAVHGRTGGLWDSPSPLVRAKLIACNNLIVPTGELLRYNTEREVLVHNTALSQKAMEQVIAHGFHGGIFWVENQPGNGHLEDTKAKVIALRASGSNAGIIYDLVHDLGEDGLTGELFNRRWPKALRNMDSLENLRDANGAKIPYGIHLSIGKAVNDSLPQLSDGMWEDVSSILKKGNPRRIVFEYQSLYLQDFFIPSKAEKREAAGRIGVIFNRLLKAGLFAG